MIITTLPDPETYKHWRGILGLLRRSAERFGGKPYTPGELVWVVIDDKQIIGAFTTDLDDEGNAVILTLGGHRIREWLADANDWVEAWARSVGAKKTTAKGRKGWTALCGACGWKVIGREDNRMIYEKVLNDGRQ